MDLVRIFADAEDRLFPSLRLTTHERALYYHLLRHSRFDGRASVTRTKQQLADALDLAPTTIRNALRALARAGCIRIAARLGLRGMQLDIRLPAEIFLRCHPEESAAADDEGSALAVQSSDSSALLPKRGRADGRFRSPAVRDACFAREGGRCFYCLRALREGAWSLDHVVPLVAGGDDSAANAVAVCHECNCSKGESAAPDFLRSLYRRGLLTAVELESRVKALQSL